MKSKWLEYYVIRKSGLFDPYYYLREYSDVRRGDVDPLRHFVTVGWKEGRNPSSRFDTKYYLESNPDVQAAGVNPLYHYIRYGRAERRAVLPRGVKRWNFSLGSQNYRPKVSVIVPNYNHRPYLKERLDSVYGQTYQNLEVILLDDCSGDESVSLLKSYAEAHAGMTRCYFNDANSGYPFSQWAKGIQLATGELVWIAESDDFCDRDFLQKLVPYFSDDSILLSYAHTVFVDQKGRRHDHAFENYAAQIDAIKWNASYTETAHDEVNAALGILNTIPNVSGVLFRKPADDFPLFSDAGWKSMRVCGDWLFYLHLIRGGRVAYCCDTHNYYRLHPASTSKATHTRDIYYREHERIARTVAQLYRVPEDLLGRFHRRLKDFYFQNVPGGSRERFDALFDLPAVLRCREERKPNVLMATYGFAFGGGEIFPIRLANALQAAGAGVTFFNGGYEPTQPTVKSMLSPGIAVISNAPSHEMGEILKHFGTEIVHSHHASMENYFAVTCPKDHSGIKHVATMHGMYEMMDAGHFMRGTRDIRHSVDLWVYTAEKNIRPFKEHGLFDPQRFTRIDNGIKFQRYRQLDLSPLGIREDSFVICLASRALPEKGWLEAIEAVAQARESTNRDIHLLLIGEGPMYELLQSRELPGFVHLLGYRADLDDYLASSQLGMLPSYFPGESFPLVLMECFMAEIPAVATNIGEIARLITTDDNRLGGALVELRNGKVHPDDLAQAVIKLVTDREFYANCVSAVRTLKTRFDIATSAQQYLAAYRRILE